MQNNDTGTALWLIMTIALGICDAFIIYIVIRNGFVAGVVVAIGCTNVMFLAGLELFQGTFSTGTTRVQILWGGVFFASIILIVWSIPLAVEVSRTP